MDRWPTLRRVVLHAATVASPGLLVLLLLLVLGVIAPGVAALALAVVLLATAVLVWPYVLGVDSLQVAVDRLERHGDSPGPDTGPSESLRRVWDAVRRMHHEKEQGRRAVEQRLQAEEAILTALPDPLLLIDPARRVVRANAAAAELFGGSPVGRDLAAAIRHPAVLAAADAVLAGEASRAVDFAVSTPVARELVARIMRLEHAAGMPRDGVLEDVAALLSLHDVTAIKRAERMRADFVANASHELRTPLSTLVGFVETLQGPARDDEEARDRFLAIMHEQAHRMARLVEDLLSLSRIEQDEHTPPSGRVDLGEIVHAAVETMEMKARSRGSSIDLVATAGLPLVQADADQIAQVLQNLIDNAIKYGRRGTPVAITLQRSPRGTLAGGRPGIALAVADQGEGIPREHLSRLTERFYRVDPARSRAMGGTGLGLAIVKHIVARHRGRLDIASEPGQGSRFTIHLPVAEPPPSSN
ncbi:two-component system phosphate regulon sensor histidine kinase PhoR [Stella humosa]|uniref:histidine kinase n=1 Tax=Stella humosa TaxID=94 RepID=A0A3N1LCS3_9PROT|nr:ATP-binding protein [Stella humosa]ROP90841.1 two-component system phosphate regulon sensor histidine kinase PhoR [Stella humosa]BBK34813.1 histidine kinase [Stella humosa]